MGDPRSSRPRFPDPEEYGRHLEEGAAPLRPWAECRARLGSADLYWLATTRRDGRPHTVPIGGVWSEDRLWFNTSPQTIVARALEREPRALVHLESGEDVLIVEGVARRLDPAQVPADVVVSYAGKYGGEWDPMDPDPAWLWLVLEPSTAISWSSADMRNTATRFDFA